MYAGTRLPSPEAAEALLVLGGPMGVHDQATLPWLTPEKHYIEAVLRRPVPVLGICLGAQLMADVLGAPVRRAAQQEIGWFPVTFAEEAFSHRFFHGFPARLTVMHWHGDTFERPAGMLPVGQSDACADQGFFDPEGRILGLQFHMEWDRRAVSALIEACPEDLRAGGPYVQSRQAMLDPQAPFAAALEHMDRLLDRLYGGQQPHTAA